MPQFIFNGGEPMDGCPKSWDDANAWAGVANENREDYEVPTWRFDCGFKLDFDGPIVRVSSRFYPPKSNYGPKWDGTVAITVADKEVIEKGFEFDTLDQLRAEVEAYVDEQTRRIHERIAAMFKESP
jgi:hypothetical protein